MVRLVIWFCCLLLLPAVALAGQHLQLVVADDQVELGRPVQAEILAMDFDRSLDSIELQPWKKNFGVVIKAPAEPVEDRRWSGQAVQRLRLELYPRREGQLEIAPLVFADPGRLGHRSDPHTINVISGSVAGVPLGVSVNVSQQQPWQRQQVLVTLSVTTPERFASLQAEAITGLAGFEVVLLPATRERIESEGADTQLSIGWALFPLLAGSQTIDLPVISYRLGGREQRHYFLPPLQLDVQALPPYVPPTLPVGEVSIVSEPVNGELQPGKLKLWNVSLQGPGVPAHWLPPLLNQIQTDESIQFLPAELARSTKPDLSGVHGEVMYQIPFKPLRSGFLQLPEFHLQYFDPITGRLMTVTHQPHQPLVLGLAWRVLFSVVSLVLLAVCGWWLLKLTRTWFVRRGHYRQAAIQIAKAKDAQQLRAALQALAAAEGWGKNLTLHDWAEAWRKSYHANEAFEMVLANLSTACYGHEPIAELPKLRSDLLTLLKTYKRSGTR